MPEYSLYTYYRSSCSARVRIALNLKGVDHELVPVNVLKDEHLAPAYRELNPSPSVPLLIHHKNHHKGDSSSSSAPARLFKVGQSVAALEYLDEVHPGNKSLMPPASDPEARATVRTLVSIIACDTQPVTNLRITRRIQGLGGDAEQWSREFYADGLRAYETIVKECGGRYSFGDEVTVADAVLMPAVWNAQRVGCDMTPFPTIEKIAENMERLDEVRKASYHCQPDTPEEMRK